MGKEGFGHNVFSQEKDHRTHLTSPTLYHNLGHVDDVSHCFYVLSFPALDGFRKDLQFKLFPLPQLLALRLGITVGCFISRRAGANPNHPNEDGFTSNALTATWAQGWSCQGIRKACFGSITQSLLKKNHSLAIYEVMNTLKCQRNCELH